MEVMTNLPGRIRNTNLPKSHALLPLFEAVVNSIHAIIEDTQLFPREGEIRIEVSREDVKQLSLDAELPEREIIGFRIVDNGVGYFGYNDNYLAYTEVISYDKLLQDAFQRNQAFFEKLGLSCIG